MDVGAPALLTDLDGLAARYSGLPKITRLRYVAEKCPRLATRALQLAVEEVKAHTCDVSTYSALAQRLAYTGFKTDTEWIKKTETIAMHKRQLIEAELQTHLGHAIRESIRRAYLDKAMFELERGEVNSSRGTLLRARDYAANSHQTAELTLAGLELACLARDMDSMKALALRPELQVEAAASAVAAARLGITCGYELLWDGRYSECADRLLNLPLGLGLGVTSTQGMSGSGVDAPMLAVAQIEEISPAAILSALASYTRDRLSSLVSSPQGGAKAVLEGSPACKDVLLDVVAGKHAAALAKLSRLRLDLELDWGVGEVLDRLLHLIRRRCLAWHLAPYSACSLHDMAVKFGQTVPALEAEVASLIAFKLVHGRIDGMSKVFTARIVDPRAQSVGAMLEAKAAVTAEARVVLLKAAIDRAGGAGAGVDRRSGGTSAGKRGALPFGDGSRHVTPARPQAHAGTGGTESTGMRAGASTLPAVPAPAHVPQDMGVLPGQVPGDEEGEAMEVQEDDVTDGESSICDVLEDKEEDGRIVAPLPTPAAGGPTGGSSCIPPSPSPIVAGADVMVTDKQGATNAHMPTRSASGASTLDGRGSARGHRHFCSPSVLKGIAAHAFANLTSAGI